MFRNAAMITLCLIATGCGPKPNFVAFDTYAAGESAMPGFSAGTKRSLVVHSATQSETAAQCAR